MGNIQINLWGIILAYGALQGFFICTVLALHNKGNNRANRFLTALVFVISLQLSAATFSIADIYERFPHLLHITTPFWFLIGPLLFFYIQSLTGKKITLDVAKIGHALPAIFCLWGLSSFYTLPAEIKISINNALYQHSQPQDKALFFWSLYLILLLGYVHVSKRLLNHFEFDFKLKSSNTIITCINWLKLTLRVFGIYLLVGFTTLLLLIFARLYVPLIDYASLFILAVFIHRVAFTAIRHPEKLFFRIQASNGTAAREPHLPLTDVEERTQQLLDLMAREKPYLECDLKIGDLANRIVMPTHHLSQLINHSLGENFYEFVNKYRVEEAKKRLLDPAYAHLTILGIALDVGFNSKASFNRIFKKQVGVTPSEFIKVKSELPTI